MARQVCARKWRTRRMIAFVIIGLLVCFLVYRASYGKMKKEMRSIERFKDLDRQGQTNVILSAYMNSGSRFVGNLLGFHNNSFYFYEPLWKFTVWDYFKPPNVRCSTTEGSCREVKTVDVNRFKPNPAFDDTVEIISDVDSSLTPVDLMLDVLSSIFQCDLVRLKELVQERVHDDLVNTGSSWQAYTTCLKSFNPKSKCLRELEGICNNRTTRVVKMLRLTMTAFRPLLEANKHLTIVHLVRDPRAIIHSRLNTRFYPVSIPRINYALEKNLCDKMLIDLTEFIRLKKHFPGRMHLIFYEDLMENLHARVKKLYKSVNLIYNQEEINKHSEIKVNLGNTEMGSKFAKDRKANNSIWWRNHMSWEQIQAVDERCSKVYDILGYKKLSEAYIRDLSVSSLRIPTAFEL